MAQGTGSSQLLVVGDTTVDIYSDEASLSARQLEWCPGGTGHNVARGVGLLGGSSKLLTQIGSDPFGVALQQYLADLPVSNDFLIEAENPTPITMLSPSTISGPEWHAWISDTCYGVSVPPTVYNQLGHFDWLYISGTVLPSDVGGEDVDSLVSTAHDSGLSVAFDLNGRANQWPDLDTYRSQIESIMPACDLVFASSDDLSLAGVDPTLDGVLTLLTDNTTADVFLTQGSDGAVGASVRHGNIVQRRFVPAPDVDVCDVVGAGDAFVAGVISEILAGESCLTDLITAGVTAGSAAVGSRGSLNRSDVERCYNL